WNGTNSGVRVPNGDWIPADREGLSFADATSAVFAYDIPWDKIDVATFSWQKVLGGEGAHGVLILGPRAVERLESHAPAWPLPKVFRLTKGGKLSEGIFKGETINTPSMLAVEDAIWALEWAKGLGGLEGLKARSDANAAALDKIVAERDWLGHLAEDESIRSRTSVCLTVEGADADFIKAFAGLLEKEGAAYDIAGYRDAPPGLRIWCGATVDTADIEALGPWLDWAWDSLKNCHPSSFPHQREPGERETRAARSPAPGSHPKPVARRRDGEAEEFIMTKPKVLISDKMDPNAARIFQERGCDVDVKPGMTPDELKAVIGQYDGLAIRSATKVTKDILAAATNLKVIGRAGIGVDNVDIPAASAKGVVVMNTPFGNSITTAEHAIALMFALARQLPEANERTQKGEWPKNAFMGVEVTGKTLGLIGAGNIGSIVAGRAIGLKMKVIAYDPFLTPERAVELGVEKGDLDTLLAKADFITLHTP